MPSGSSPGFTQCNFYSSAKRLESYQEAISEDEEFADSPSNSLGNTVKLPAHSCRTANHGPLGRKLSHPLAGSSCALGSGEGASETPHARQAAFSSPIVSVNA